MLKDVAGTDSTKDFDYVDHSDDAWRTMEKIQVGILDGWVEVRYHAIGMPILSPRHEKSRSIHSLMNNSRAQKGPSAPQKLARPLKNSRANIRLSKTIIRSLFLGSLILVGLVSIVHGLRSVSAGLKPLATQGSSTGKKAFIGGLWVGVLITSVAISLLIRAFSKILFPRRKGPWEYPPYFKVIAQ